MLRRLLPTATQATIVVVVCGATALPPGLARLWLTTAGMGVLAGLMWLSIGVHRPVSRTAWTWIAVGVTTLFIGDTALAVIRSLGGTDESWDLVPMLGSAAGLVAIALGLLAFARERGQSRVLDIAVDSIVMSIAVGAVAAQALALFMFSRPDLNEVYRVAVVGFAIIHILLVVAAARALVIRPARPPAAVLLLAASIGLLVASVAILVNAANDSYQYGSTTWPDLIWFASLGLFVVAAAHPSMASVGEGPIRTPQDGRTRIIVGGVCLAAPTLVLTVVTPDRVPLRGTMWGLVAALMTVLAVWRSLRLLESRNRADQQRDRTTGRYRTLAANSADASVLVDQNAIVIEASETYGEVIGDPDAAPVGQSLFHRMHPSEREAAQLGFGAVLDLPGEAVEGEVRIVNEDGTDRWMAVRVVNLLADPDVGAILVNLHDITARHRAEEQLRHQAFHDPVTGAANRAMLASQVELVSRRRAAEGGSCAMLLLDINEFTRVNERVGHDGGDALLRQIHDRLRAVVRAGDTVARLGGDEFALLIEQDHFGSSEAKVLAQRVLDRVAEPFVIAGEMMVLNATVGIATTNGATDHEVLLRDAGVALSCAKATGKPGFVVFEPAMRDEAIDRLRLEADLIAALERDQFVLHYQPLLDLETGTIRGVEALLRWDHPDVGLIAPDRFIPLAERNGLIVPIGEWVIRWACAVAARWRNDIGLDLEMSVNVSARQLGSEALVPTVRLALAESGLPAAKLVVEITETTLVADAQVAAGRIAELRDLGVRIAIDDFGTGYSSLAYLQQFPVDVLKIDRSFVNAIVEGEPMPRLVKGLVDLARTLGLETVAEGIEYEHQLDHLRHEGCSTGQGYFFARPLPEADALSVIARNALRLTS